MVRTNDRRATRCDRSLQVRRQAPSRRLGAHWRRQPLDDRLGLSEIVVRYDGVDESDLYERRTGSLRQRGSSAPSDARRAK